jgi:uncharacterized protein (DUF427 family)
MRALLAGETVLDSQRGILLWETGEFPVHYYPLDDVRQDLLEQATVGQDEDSRGQWSVKVGDRVAEDCMIASPRDANGDELLPGYVTFHQSHGPQASDPRAMDEWFEEDDPIHGHPRDPYHRVDIRSSSRHVVVRHNGAIVAESSRPKLLFETGNPIRYYLPPADVRIELLRKSDFVSACPYKDDGQHWHITIGDKVAENAAWSLPHPLLEGLAAAGHICFYPDKVEVEVDGQCISE